MKNLLKIELARDGKILSLKKEGNRLFSFNLDRFIGQDFSLFLNNFFHGVSTTDKDCRSFLIDDQGLHFFYADISVVINKSEASVDFNFIDDFNKASGARDFLNIYRQAFEYQPAECIFLSTSGEFLWKNKSFTKNELFQNNLSDVFIHQLKSNVEFGEKCFKSWIEKKPQFHEVLIVNSSIQIQIVPVYYSDDKLIGFRLEPLLVNGAKRADLSTFPMSNPNPVVQLDFDLKVLFANSAAQRVLKSDNELLDEVKFEVFNLMKKNADTQSQFSHQINFENLNYRIDFTKNKDSWNLYFIDDSEKSRINTMHSVSQAQLEAIINSSRSAIILLNQDKEITYFNKRARTDSKRFFGFELHEGSSLEDLLEGGFSRTVDVSVQTVLKSGHQINFDLDFEVNEYQKVWFSFNVYPIKNNQDKITGVCLNISNITRAKLAELEIKKTKEFYETILNNIPADIAVFDKNHNYLFINPLALKNEQLRKWLIGKNDYDYFKLKGNNFEIADKRRALFNKAIEENKTQEIIDVHVDKDNKSHYILRRFYPYSPLNEDVQLVIGYGVEITQLKEAERQFQLSEMKFRSLFENNPMLIFIVDQHFNVVSLNIAAKRHFNLSDLQSESLNMVSLIREDFCSEFTAKFSSAFMMEEGASHTCYCDLKQGDNEYSVEFSATPIYSESGEKLLMLVGADHTERIINEEKLKKSEEFNRHLVKNIPLPFAIVSFDKAEYINDAIRKLFAIPEEIDFRELSILNFVDEQYQSIIKQSISERYAGIDSGPRLLKINTFNNESKIVEVHGALMELNGRKLNFITMVDKTAEIQYSKLRKRAELKAQQIIDTALDAVVSTDSQGIIQIWNPKAEMIFGWSAEEIQGKNIAQTIIPHFHRKGHSDGMEKHMATGISNVLNKLMELTALRKDGTEFPIEIFITRIEIENEIIFSSFIRDISLRKQAEQELIASENKLSLLVQSLPVLPFTMDYSAPYEFIYLNERVDALLGYSESNVKSLKGFWISKVHPDDVSELIDNWLNYDSNQQKVFTYRIQHASGNWRWIRETSRLIIDDSGTPMSISGVFNDITQQKETEDRRQKVEKTLYEISREEKLSTDSLNGLYDLISNKLFSNFGFCGFSVWELNAGKTQFNRIVDIQTSKGNRKKQTLSSIEACLILDLLKNSNLISSSVNHEQSIGEHPNLNSIFQLNKNTSFLIHSIKSDLSKGMILLLETQETSFSWEVEHFSLVGSISEIISFNLEYFHRIEADQKLRKAYSLAKIGAWEIEEGRDSVYWSEAMFEFYGLVPNSVDPLKFEEVEPFIHPEDLQQFKDAFTKLLTEGISYRIECRHTLPDLPVRYYEKSAVAITSMSGKRIFMGVTVDITERKNIENEKSNRLQRKTISNSIAASISSVVSLDELFFKFTDTLWQSKIVKCCYLFSDENNSGNYTIKRSYPEIHPFIDELTNHLNKLVLENLKDKSLNESSFFSNEYPDYIATPVQMPGKGRCYLLLEINNLGVEINESLVLFSSIIKMVQEKAELIHAENQLRLLNNELLDTNVQLRQYSYIVSHNLRAPVANILGCISLYNDNDPADPRNEELITGLKISANSVDTILRDLNKILNIKENVFRHFETIKFEEILEFVLDSLQTETHLIKHSLISDFTEAPDMVAFRPYMVSVFQNIISNAFKYRSPSRELKITINTHRVQQKLILSFTDNGRGINLEKHGNKLFKLYSRLHTDVPGTGLGLSMVQEQVRVMGGNIQIDSQEDVGTTFILTFTIKE
jgi:PAS domain S-box-containing protein